MNGKHSADTQALKPAIRNILCWMCLVLLQGYAIPGQADDSNDEFQLPDIGYPLEPADKHQLQYKDGDDPLKLLEQHLKSYTRMQISDDSTIQLGRHGVRLKTEYQRSDITTEFEARDSGEVSFGIKIQF